MISRVSAVNFLSWTHLQRDITPGVTLIDGWNEDDQTPEGSGKSAILNAICWALYGKIPKDANIDDVIKEGEKYCEVTVEFTDGTAIRRSRKPNELLMLKDGKNIKGKDARETQTLIEEYVALSFETFCQTIYFAQGYTKKFITANQEEKGKILSEVQDLGVFDKAGKEVRSLIKMEEDSLTKLKHSKDMAQKDEELTLRDIKAEEMKHEHAVQQQAQRIQTLTLQIQSEETRIQREQLQQAEDVADVARQIEDTKKLILETEAAKAQVLDVTASLVYDAVLEKSLQDSNNQLMAQMGAVNAELAGIDKLVAKKVQSETQGKRYATRYKQVAAEKDKNLAFIANPAKDCPTCGTQLKGCDTSHAQTEVAKLEQELAEIVEALTQLSYEIETPIPTKDQLNAQLTALREQRIVNDREISNIRAVKDQMNSAAAHLSAFDRQLIQHASRLTKLEQELELEKQPRAIDTTTLEALRGRLEVESQPLAIDRTKLEELQNKLTTVKDSTEDLIRLIAEKNAHLARLENLKSGFKEIKSYVFNSMLNEINARVQKYLVHLFEVPISVRFKNEDMKIETDVVYGGAPRGLGLLSGGQFRRVSLAVDLALSDVITARKGARVGVLILDEYFKDLSESSMEKCLTLLEGRGQPVLLIEHNSIFKNIVNNSVMVRLENGTSRVEV